MHSTSGGGIGGLTLDLALAGLQDLALDVYDQATDFNIEIGADISLSPRNMPFLSKLGLADDIAAISGHRPGAPLSLLCFSIRSTLNALRAGTVFSINKADQAELKVVLEGSADGV